MKQENTLINQIDGKRFYYSFLAGAQRIFENQNLINKINVFPVADADTGTNLASTFRSIVDSPIPTTNIKTVATAIADAALVGARGNSGIIFAQFLYGFSNEINEEEAFSIESFARSVHNAVKYAYEAIANPVEGTMITVIREWAEFINKIKNTVSDFVELLMQALQEAIKSLTETTAKLENLKKANVVDAGAKGFVLFLEGMLDFFKNKGSLKNILIPKNEFVLDEPIPDMHDVITFRYCCEALLSLENHTDQTKDSIRESIKGFGDSLVVAGSDRRVRIHIHSDNPIELFDVISKKAGITYQKVDDMVMQQEIAQHSKYAIALVTDSTCDIPTELIEEHQISVIPLTLNIDNACFLDRVTISNEKFYKALDTAKQYPTTSQPSYKDFINKYAYLTSHFDSVIGVHLSKNFSGTFSNSLRAAKAISEQSGKTINVFSSNRITSGLGILVLRVAEAIQKGYTHSFIADKIDEWAIKNHLYVSVKTPKYLVKSGRLSHSKGLIAKALNINPIISMNDEGNACTLGNTFSEKGSLEFILKKVKKLLEKNTIWNYTITHINNLEMATVYAEAMEKLTQKKPLFLTECSPVLGANGGPGVVTLSVMEQ